MYERTATELLNPSAPALQNQELVFVIFWIVHDIIKQNAAHEEKI